MIRVRTIRACLVLLALLLLVALYQRPAFFTRTDLGAWRTDWTKLSKCIQAGTFPCVAADMSRFPAGYLLNSYYLSVMEAKGFDRSWALGLVNSIFLALPLAFIVLVRGIRSSLSRALIYVVAIVLTAVPPFYLYSGALEVQSGVLIGIFISCVVLLNEDFEQPRRTLLSIVLFVTAVLLPFYKDTNVFVLLVGLAVAGIQTRRHKRNLSAVWSVLVPVTIGLGSAMTYNFIKYGSVLPLAYLDEASQTSPPLATTLEFFVATYFSPNGGIIVFWACALCALFWLLRGFNLSVSPIGASAAVVVVLINSILLAGWWAPFGWDTWGNRLMIPAMLAMVICLAATARARNSDQQHAAKSAARGYLLMRVCRNGALAGAALLSLHYTFVSYRSKPDAVFRTSLFGGPKCQQMVRDFGANAAAGLAFFRSDSYYACARERFLHVPRHIAK